jgi:arylsulfatase A
LRGFKGSVYEGGLRVPLIVRFPGHIAAGTVNHTPGYFADWFPTLCEAANLKPPDGLDGESLWPALTGNKSAPRSKPMLWIFPEYGGQVAVRIDDFKLVRRALKSRSPTPWEVYDLSQDPAEALNLAATQTNLIHAADSILAEQIDANPVFPVPIPSAHTAAPPCPAVAQLGSNSG